MFEIQPMNAETYRQQTRRSTMMIALIFLALAMALHELGTNAAKYGALSSREGRVCLHWSSTDLDGDPRIEVVWQEHGGPAVHEPAQRGFGSRLLERGLKHDLGGGVELAFAPDGVRCHLWMPQPNLEEGQLT